eukprot:9332369-Pyramimonas_sp.AAC.1
MRGVTVHAKRLSLSPLPTKCNTAGRCGLRLHVMSARTPRCPQSATSLIAKQPITVDSVPPLRYMLWHVRGSWGIGRFQLLNLPVPVNACHV